MPSRYATAMRFTPTNKGRGKIKLGKRFRQRIFPSVWLQTHTYWIFKKLVVYATTV